MLNPRRHFEATQEAESLEEIIGVNRSGTLRSLLSTCRTHKSLHVTTGLTPVTIFDRPWRVYSLPNTKWDLLTTSAMEHTSSVSPTGEKTHRFLRTVILCEQTNQKERFYVSRGFTPFSLRVTGMSWQAPLLIRIIGEAGLVVQWSLGYDPNSEIKSVEYYPDWLDF